MGNKIMIFTSSPNQDGLTAACGEAAYSGAQTLEAEIEYIRLNDLNLEKCRACERGWGICNEEHKCIIEDDFEKIHEKIAAQDAFIIITPVYWGEMSESAKIFFDRLRRCEASKNFENKKSDFQDKPVIAVAAAGGSGGGIVTCLSQMKNLFSHMGGNKFDLIGVTQKNRSYKVNTVKQSAEKMVNEI